MTTAVCTYHYYTAEELALTTEQLEAFCQKLNAANGGRPSSMPMAVIEDGKIGIDVFLVRQMRNAGKWDR